jgi:hypothetical protein
MSVSAALLNSLLLTICVNRKLLMYFYAYHVFRKLLAVHINKKLLMYVFAAYVNWKLFAAHVYFWNLRVIIF